MITATDNCHFQGYDLTTRYDLLVIYKSQTNYLPNVLTIIMRVADSLFILQTWDRIDKNSGLAILFLHHGKQVKLLSNWNQICLGLLNLFKCCLSFFSKHTNVIHGNLMNMENYFMDESYSAIFWSLFHEYCFVKPLSLKADKNRKLVYSKLIHYQHN